MSIRADWKIPTPSGLRREFRNSSHLLRRMKVSFLLLIALLVAAQASMAQAAQSETPDYSTNPKWFPQIFSPYRSRQIPPLDQSNTKALSQMIREGKIELSLSQLAAAVVENNLDIAVARYNRSVAQADLLRANGGQAARGVDAAGAGIPDALFASAIGAGVGNIAGLGGIGLTGSISGLQRTLSLSPRGAFDPTLIFNLSWDRTSSPLNTLVVAGSPTVITNTAFYQFGWQQAFTTGTSFSVQLSNQRQSSTQQSLIYNPDVISRMSVNVVQQLTNGFGFEVNRRFQTVARNNLRIVREWFQQQVSTILTQAQSSYWDLVSAQEQVRATEEALKVAQELYEDNKQRAAIGVVAPLDVVSAEAQVAANRRDLIVAQTNLQQQELSFKTFFSKQITDVLGAAQIVATDRLPEPQDADIPPLEEAISAAVLNRPELAEAKGAVMNDQVAVRVTRSFLKPTFNLFGQFATAGLSGNQLVSIAAGSPPTRLQAGLAQELNQVIHFKYPEYAAGFALTIPIRNRSALADNIRAGLVERQAETALQRTRNQVGMEVHTAITRLIQAKAQVTAAENAVDYSKQDAGAEQTKLELGSSTPYDLILAQRNSLAAELADVQARASYAKALVEMDRSQGVLLEKNHIDLEDALRGRVSQEGRRE
jgi:outer membrane protein